MAKAHFTGFVCDRCGEIASVARSESEALTKAREKANRDGWDWRHPGWVLICPRCLSYEKERKQ